MPYENHHEKLMNNDWKNYLLSQDATFTEDAAFRFNDEGADNLKTDSTDIICDLVEQSFANS